MRSETVPPRSVSHGTGNMSFADTLSAPGEGRLLLHAVGGDAGVATQFSRRRSSSRFSRFRPSASFSRFEASPLLVGGSGFIQVVVPPGQCRAAPDVLMYVGFDRAHATSPRTSSVAGLRLTKGQAELPSTSLAIHQHPRLEVHGRRVGHVALLPQLLRAAAARRGSSPRSGDRRAALTGHHSRCLEADGLGWPASAQNPFGRPCLGERVRAGHRRG